MWLRLVLALLLGGVEVEPKDTWIVKEVIPEKYSNYRFVIYRGGSGEEYGRTDQYTTAQAWANVLNRHGLGPYWHYGLKAQTVIDTERLIMKEAFAEARRLEGAARP